MDRRSLIQNLGLLVGGILLSKEEVLERLNHKKIYALGSWEKRGYLWTRDNIAVASAYSAWNPQRKVWIMDFSLSSSWENVNKVTYDGVTYMIASPINVRNGDNIQAVILP